MRERQQSRIDAPLTSGGDQMRVLTLAMACALAAGQGLVVAPHLQELLLLLPKEGSTHDTHEAISTVALHSVGQGMHVDLNLTIQVTATSNPSHVSLLCVFVLPPGCFADKDELRSRHRGFDWSKGVRVHAAAATSNPELLAEEAASEVLGVEFVDMPGSSPLAHSFALPIHLRYHRATSHRASGRGVDYVNVSIPRPIVFICPSPATAGGGAASTRIVTGWEGPLRPLLRCRLAPPAHLDIAPASVVLRMPMGDLDGLTSVQAATWATLTATTAWLLGATLL